MYFIKQIGIKHPNNQYKNTQSKFYFYGFSQTIKKFG